MKVLDGARVTTISRDELLDRVRAYDRVIVDVGSGDGQFAFKHAVKHREAFVIGIDASADRLARYAKKAARKPERGGTSNVVFVVAGVEAMPEELRGLADEIFVLLPWGSLLDGIVAGDPAVLASLERVAKPGATLHLVVNLDMSGADVPDTVVEMNNESVDQLRQRFGLALGRGGIELVDVRAIDVEELRALPTSWGKRLSHRGHDPRAIRVTATFR